MHCIVSTDCDHCRAATIATTVLWPLYRPACVDDDDDMTVLMCAQKLTDANLIYRTEPETKNRKEKN